MSMSTTAKPVWPDADNVPGNKEMARSAAARARRARQARRLLYHADDEYTQAHKGAFTHSSDYQTSTCYTLARRRAGAARADKVGAESG